MTYLEKTTRIHEEKLSLILGKLYELKLVKRETVLGEKMYRLTYLGYDMLALRDLVERNVIEAIGDRVGVGKESEIYLALAPGGIQVAIKFLRFGRTSFRQTKKKRPWTTNPSLSWYRQSQLAAEREYEALNMLVKYDGALVPKPFARSRHVVVTEYIEGVELYRRPALGDPERVLNDIILTLGVAYHKAGIVHGDLSEYNIMVRIADEKPFIIDWPQYVFRSDPLSIDLLRRDVYYTVRFFNKVYGLTVDYEHVLRDIVLEGELP